MTRRDPWERLDQLTALPEHLAAPGPVLTRAAWFRLAADCRVEWITSGVDEGVADFAFGLIIAAWSLHPATIAARAQRARQRDDALSALLGRWTARRRAARTAWSAAPDGRAGQAERDGARASRRRPERFPVTVRRIG